MPVLARQNADLAQIIWLSGELLRLVTCCLAEILSLVVFAFNLLAFLVFTVFT